MGHNGIVSHDIVSSIEIENSRHALVEGNYVYSNTGGILAVVTPGLPIKTCGDVLIRNNFIVDNNHENFAIPGSLVSNIPAGTGVLVMACDDVVVEGNIITGNNSVGITFTDFALAGNAASDTRAEPVPPRSMEDLDKGKLAFYGVCAGCHAYGSRMIGPPTQIIQALYMDFPEGIAEYVANPVKKRPDYPEMPPQVHLDAETRLAVVKFMLQVKN